MSDRQYQHLNSAFEMVDFCGGKAHKISDKIYHLMRGEIFTIDGKTIFAMGGAESHDKESRTEGESWWAGELPSPDDYANADKNLARCNDTVDYVITHCAATAFQRKNAPTYPINELTEYFEGLQLVLPTPCYKEKILAYKADFLAHGDSMDGTAGLSTAESFEARRAKCCRLRCWNPESLALKTC